MASTLHACGGAPIFTSSLDEFEQALIVELGQTEGQKERGLAYLLDY